MSPELKREIPAPDLKSNLSDFSCPITGNEKAISVLNNSVLNLIFAFV
jgi:hypothetical protein